MKRQRTLTRNVEARPGGWRFLLCMRIIRPVDSVNSISAGIGAIRLGQISIACLGVRLHFFLDKIR